jgi:ABC-type dipeptide/oligopeptide/nickel transport system permease component
MGATAGSATTAQIGVVARILLPTDGLWRGATAAFRRDTLIDEIARTGGLSMVSGSAVTPAHLG